jgi:four helix bundle protein
MRKELENRLVNLSLQVNVLTRKFDDSFASYYYKGQIIRSSSSAAMNYGEAIGAETKKDFAHKIGIVLKELRETYIILRIIRGTDICKAAIADLDLALDECNQLVAIFHKTALTLKKKNKPG